MSRNTKKRICVYSGLGLLALALLLHSYSRQMVFGPRIHGMPFSYWQDRYRDAEASGGPPSPFTLRVLAFLGIKHSSGIYYIPADPEMIPVALSLLDDPNPAVRASLAASLAIDPDSQEACDGLMRLAADDSARVRQQAVLFLPVIAPIFEPARARLRELMKDDDPICRVRAAYGFCKVALHVDNEAIAVFHMALEADDFSLHPYSTWNEAADRLSKLGKENPAFLEVLASALPKDAQARQYCAFHFERAGLSAVPFLVQMLEHDTDREVRQMAASCLGRLGPGAAESIPALVRARDDPNEFMRYEAAQALVKIDSQQFVEPRRPVPNAPR